MVENAIRFEPLEEIPVDFSQLFLEQVKVEKPIFQVLNLVDLVSSILIAITIGTAFLIFAFLPEHLNPTMQWFLQSGEYWLTKILFNLPGIILTLGAAVLSIVCLIAIVNGAQNLLNKNKERRNFFSVL
jgi:multisubunit Na+/H+ antiporter MnhB subunit